jgi:hypothetical protein
MKLATKMVTRKTAGTSGTALATLSLSVVGNLPVEIWLVRAPGGLGSGIASTIDH